MTSSTPQTSKKHVYLSFDTLLDIMGFTLDNPIIQMPDGTLRHQRQGIPMGDPLSPGMCITTCAWMERRWLGTLTPEQKETFRVARYMDDMLMFIAERPDRSHTAILHDFEKACYKPLKLEDGAPNTFLETQFAIQNQDIRFWLKNDNAQGENKIWRYQHYKSHSPFLQKQAVLTACLRKVQKMSSDNDTLYDSGLAKVREFSRLAYPPTVLRGACTYLGATTGTYKWYEIRDQI